MTDSPPTKTVLTLEAKGSTSTLLPAPTPYFLGTPFISPSHSYTPAALLSIPLLSHLPCARKIMKPHCPTREKSLSLRGDDAAQRTTARRVAPGGSRPEGEGRRYRGTRRRLSSEIGSHTDLRAGHKKPAECFSGLLSPQDPAVAISVQALTAIRSRGAGNSLAVQSI